MNAADRLHQKLGAELNDREGRSDGEVIAKNLRESLDHELEIWLHNHLYPAFHRIPLSEWSHDLGAELLARSELACLQAVESAIFAGDCEYLRSEPNWIAGWLVRLIVGDSVAADAAEKRFAGYFAASPEDRLLRFARLLSGVFPKTNRSGFCVGALSPLIPPMAKALTAAAFSDQSVAAVQRAKYDRVNTIVSAAIEQSETGGGWHYVVEGSNRICAFVNIHDERAYLVWTDKECAQKFAATFGGDHHVSSMCYRELKSQLTDAKEKGVTLVAVNRLENRVWLVPLDRVVESLRSEIERVDSTEMCDPAAACSLILNVDSENVPYLQRPMLQSLGRQKKSADNRDAPVIQRVQVKSDRPEETDEFMRDREIAKSHDASFSDYLPVDCGNCGESFYVHETQYRRWRAELAGAFLLCPKCLHGFWQARYGSVSCCRCGSDSLLMPLNSVCVQFKRDNNYKCLWCLLQEIDAAPAAVSIQPRREH